MISLRDRLLAKAVINWETGCWEWTANRDHRGYGRIKIGGEHGRKARAHRVSYELAYGPIPDGLVIDHLCRVRHCINPDHMEPVTTQVNWLRGLGLAPAHAARSAFTCCPRGHEFTPENTYVTPGGRRQCRPCKRVRDASRTR